MTRQGNQVLTFTLGEETYGVDILRVQEIRGWSPVTRIPQSPDSLLGVLNLRGAIVPIIDLRVRFAPVRVVELAQEHALVASGVAVGNSVVALGAHLGAGGLSLGVLLFPGGLALRHRTGASALLLHVRDGLRR